MGKSYKFGDAGAKPFKGKDNKKNRRHNSDEDNWDDKRMIEDEDDLDELDDLDPDDFR